ncbi:hypothetical protein O987_15217 [Comamonas testosteroni TK102]|jgi:hypothetical protein|uniref:Uncharacterized protein n=1 Tax=Comamonas testosteroni TK102 TaxID=1392005 RepID=A0A076PJW7_COMTE|nr:hypothetical protein [Comamonas testosteroni]AIJ47154.1 hypothetical protein O987_15217 [Comamonas testosteroni TK102]
MTTTVTDTAKAQPVKAAAAMSLMAWPWDERDRKRTPAFAA